MKNHLYNQQQPQQSQPQQPQQSIYQFFNHYLIIYIITSYFIFIVCTTSTSPPNQIEYTTFADTSVISSSQSKTIINGVNVLQNGQTLLVHVQEKSKYITKRYSVKDGVLSEISSFYFTLLTIPLIPVNRIILYANSLITYSTKTLGNIAVYNFEQATYRSFSYTFRYQFVKMLYSHTSLRTFFLSTDGQVGYFQKFTFPDLKHNKILILTDFQQKVTDIQISNDGMLMALVQGVQNFVVFQTQSFKVVYKKEGLQVENISVLITWGIRSNINQNNIIYYHRSDKNGYFSVEFDKYFNQVKNLQRGVPIYDKQLYQPFEMKFMPAGDGYGKSLVFVTRQIGGLDNEVFFHFYEFSTNFIRKTKKQLSQTIKGVSFYQADVSKMALFTEKQMFLYKIDLCNPGFIKEKYLNSSLKLCVDCTQDCTVCSYEGCPPLAEEQVIQDTGQILPNTSGSDTDPTQPNTTGTLQPSFANLDIDPTQSKSGSDPTQTNTPESNPNPTQPTQPKSDPNPTQPNTPNLDPNPTQPTQQTQPTQSNQPKSDPSSTQPNTPNLEPNPTQTNPPETDPDPTPNIINQDPNPNLNPNNLDNFQQQNQQEQTQLSKQIQTFQGTLNGILRNNFTQSVNFMPGSRKIFSIFYSMFTNFDDIWLYSYHQRVYNSALSKLFIMIREFQSEKWDLISYTQLWNIFGIDMNRVKITLQLKTQYTSDKFKQIENISNGFIPNTMDYLFSSIFFTFLLFMLFKLLFSLTFNYKISILIRPYSFWPTLMLMFLQGNIQYFSYLLTFQVVTLFSRTFFYKLMYISLLLVLFIIVFGLNVLFSYVKKTYGKLSKYFFNNLSPIDISMWYMTMNYGIRNLAFGIVHYLMQCNYELKICWLTVLEFGFSLLNIVLLRIDSCHTLKTRKHSSSIKQKLKISQCTYVFSSKTKVFLSGITCSIIRIILNISLIIQNDQQISQNNTTPASSQNVFIRLHMFLIYAYISVCFLEILNSIVISIQQLITSLFSQPQCKKIDINNLQQVTDIAILNNNSIINRIKAQQHQQKQHQQQQQHQSSSSTSTSINNLYIPKKRISRLQNLYNFNKKRYSDRPIKRISFLAKNNKQLLNSINNNNNNNNMNNNTNNMNNTNNNNNNNSKYSNKSHFFVIKQKNNIQKEVQIKQQIKTQFSYLHKQQQVQVQVQVQDNNKQQQQQQQQQQQTIINNNKQIIINLLKLPLDNIKFNKTPSISSSQTTRSNKFKKAKCIFNRPVDSLNIFQQQDKIDNDVVDNDYEVQQQYVD